MGKEEKKSAPNSAEIFISHNNRDSDLAAALCVLIRKTSAGYLKPFASSEVEPGKGIAYGDDWKKAILERLKTTSVVLALLTENSARSPWVFYELGFVRASKTVTSIGYLLGNQTAFDLGPLEDTQVATHSESSLLRLLEELIKNSGGDPDRRNIKEHIGKFHRDIVQPLEMKKEGSANLPVFPPLLCMGADKVGIVDRLLNVASQPSAYRWYAASSVCFSAIPWLEGPSQRLYHAILEGKGNQKRSAIEDVKHALALADNLTAHSPDNPTRAILGLLNGGLTQIG